MSDYVEGFVAEKNFVLISQKAIVLNRKNEILFLKRSEKSGKVGRWDLCGGGLDKNENPIEGIVREIKEEAGLEVKDVNPIAVTSFNEEDFVVMIGYQVSAVTEEVILSWEHDEYKWVPRKESLDMDLPAFFKEMISSLR
jgi:8-oxo-dGTP diphosphatase